jgi:prepilin-type N-terminal cleavage/methylation domain-containing protein/prepilin-type processing-associated H-X9-DG protein
MQTSTAPSTRCFRAKRGDAGDASRRRPRCPRLGRRTGFSLIELLVVVSIIVLLSGILLVALSGSKEQARALACKSNLSQWGNTLMHYAADNQQYLPYEDRGEEAQGHVCWYDALDELFRNPDKQAGVKLCPTVALTNPHVEESFRMNSKLAETNPSSKHFRPYRRLPSLDLPTKTAVLFDGDTGGDMISFKGRWRLSDDDVNYRHLDSGNVLFADMHVENFRRADLRRASVNNDEVVWQPMDMGPWDPKAGD